MAKTPTRIAGVSPVVATILLIAVAVVAVGVVAAFVATPGTTTTTTTTTSSTTTTTTTTPSGPVTSDLRTQGEMYPIDLATCNPTFSWTYSSNNGDNQSNYEIWVGTSSGDNSIWASGQVASSETSAVYGGDNLSARVTYYIQVRTKDGHEWSFWAAGTFRIDPNPQYVCAFFYPWYGKNSRYGHWSEANHNPPDTWAANYLPDPIPGSFDPANELYSSDNENIILWQLGSMKRAGIMVAISSWWEGSYSDQVFSEIITDVMARPENPYPGLKWAIYYEGEGYGNPSVDNICADLSYIDNNYGSSPYYFKIDGKIVVFVYGDASDGAAYAQRWDNVRSRLGNVYVVLKVFGGYLNYASCADSWHQYAPDKDYEAQAPYSAFVSPGFWKYDEGFQRLPRNLSEFESAVQTLMNSGYKFLLIQTWNEWHEGTQIEPGQLINHDDSSPPFTEAENSYGYDYIDILAKYTNPQS